MEDIAIDAGRILQRGLGLDLPAYQVIDLQGRLVIPGFIEPHLHLDIALMNSWGRPGRTEPFGIAGGLNEVLERRRKDFTLRDIEERTGAAIELASRHGITISRAQCYVDQNVGLRHLEALLTAKERYAGQVDLQIVAFPQLGLLRLGTLYLFREAFRMGQT